eukprot:TRINITY_DN26328_c0_g2_i1.p1 TRINITY_DN26328_c0_g2~~TRINITY_DN26328_c0_g2_i1.p1  ORF type:complete len:175 (+),score=10.79 TRINITY_DN26328_c0_g2_i1:376-900(+)
MFVKMVIYYLILKLLFFDAFVSYASTKGSFCTNYAAANVGKACAYTISGYNLKGAASQQFIDIIDILALAFTIISIIFFIVFRKRMAKIRDWLDFNTISQDDYTILVEDIPKYIFEEGMTKDEIDFDYKMWLEYIFEEKVKEWLEKINTYTDDKDCQNPIEKDFYKFVYKKYQD